MRKLTSLVFAVGLMLSAAAAAEMGRTSYIIDSIDHMLLVDGR